MRKMKLVLIRHGQSEWNKLNLFTGWHDVDLSQEGVVEAMTAGKRIKEAGLGIRCCLHFCFNASY